MLSSLFCYGTLEFPEIMYRVTGEIFPCEVAWIHDYARYMVRNQSFPGLVYEQGSQTQGTLYHEIRPRHLKRLDAYEGLLYSRELLTVETAYGDHCTALVYVVPQQKRSMLSPREWDQQAFARQDYLRFLKREFR